jgi:hypothetical protein
VKRRSTPTSVGADLACTEPGRGVPSRLSREAASQVERADSSALRTAWGHAVPPRATFAPAFFAIHADGRHLYGSNRGHDSIAVFEVDRENGRLAPIQHAPTRGSKPRSFALDRSGRWIIATNHDSGNATVFAVDPDTGRLTQVGEPVSIPMPCCVRFQPLP